MLRRTRRAGCRRVAHGFEAIFSINAVVEIAGNAPLSLAGNKRVIRELIKVESKLDPEVEPELVELRRSCFLSEDFQEGVQAFAEKHRWLSTSPDSGFVRVLTLQRRDATGVDILRGCVLQRVGEPRSTRDLASRSELDDALGDVFGLDLTDLDEERLGATWERMQREHERWVAAGRP